MNSNSPHSFNKLEIEWKHVLLTLLHLITTYKSVELIYRTLCNNFSMKSSK